MTTDHVFKTAAICLRGGQWLHNKCYHEATKNADSPFRGRVVTVMRSRWPKGNRCAVCGGGTRKVRDMSLPDLASVGAALAKRIAFPGGWFLAISRHGTVVWQHYRRYGEHVGFPSFSAKAKLVCHRFDEFLGRCVLCEGKLDMAALERGTLDMCRVLGVDGRAKEKLVALTKEAAATKTTLLIGITEIEANGLLTRSMLTTNSAHKAATKERTK